jgi:hypothetical protein
MSTTIGICTCGNHKSSRRTIHSLITEYSKIDFDKMMISDFGKKHNYNLNFIYDSLTKQVSNENKVALLEAASGNHGHAINELAIWLSHKWKVGETIRVKFLNKNPTLEEFVKRATKEWMEYANVVFSFVEDDNAEIRIEFASDNTYWSQIGTLCKIVADPNQPTMHLGFSGLSIGDDVIYGTILHEFGHALGCIHEHQHPTAGIRWNEKEIIDDFIKYGWDEEKIRHNVLNTFPQDDISNSEYDRDSIMHYFFPAKYNLDGIEFQQNIVLSQKDKDFMKFCYPYNKV